MKELLFYHTISLGLGILLDQFIGDPKDLPHPVRAMGKLILSLEKRLLEEDRPGKAKGRGVLLWILVVCTVTVCTLVPLGGAYLLHPFAGMLLETILTAYILAARSLCRESMAVYRKLKEGDTEGAKAALSMIVGRDTDDLTEEEIAAAAVETVAENTSDGVIAPLLFTALGGPVLGLFYKAVNTMDSMLGYRSERYERFGWFAARSDDVMNFLPSRISALLMILAAAFLGLFSKDVHGKDALRIWKRDRRNHTSPNSAQTESVCAGALGLKLGGTHRYGGREVLKPTIGDGIRTAGACDIKRANMLMFATEAFAAAFIFAILAVFLCFGSL